VTKYWSQLNYAALVATYKAVSIIAIRRNRAGCAFSTRRMVRDESIT